MIKTDFCECKHLFLAYPKGFSNEYETLVPFYHELINLIPDDINLKIIVNTKKSERQLMASVKPKRNLEIIVVNFFDEIWLRDCMGLVANSKILKFNYSPKYCSLNKEVSYYRYINKLAKRILSRSLSLPVIDVPLNLDGGNFVHNGHTVFMTEKVVEDNPNKDVKQIIKTYTGLEAVIVKKCNHDVIGHTDGYMAFKDQSTLFISQYPVCPYLEEDQAYSQMLKSVALENGFKVLPIFDQPIDEAIECACNGAKTRGCLFSAKGVYVNFIRFNNYIIMPEYAENQNSEMACSWMNKKWLESLGFDVLTINCDRLAQFGGSLHCISFQS